MYPGRHVEFGVPQEAGTVAMSTEKATVVNPDPYMMYRALFFSLYKGKRQDKIFLQRLYKPTSTIPGRPKVLIQNL